MGNIDAMRDWGYAPEYVEAMWLMLQQNEPDDYVVASGEMHSVREFIEKAFACTGRNIAWHGEGVNEYGVDEKSGKTIVKIDPRYFRPAEVDQLLGNPVKAKEKLGWQASCKFEKLVQIMMEADLNKLAPNK